MPNKGYHRLYDDPDNEPDSEAAVDNHVYDENLPAGMRIVGYDADEERYTFRDADGSLWEGQPRTRYGPMHRVGQRPAHEGISEAEGKRQEREFWRYFLPFLLLVGLFLLLVLRLTHPELFGGASLAGPALPCKSGQQTYRVVGGDTCWELAQTWQVSVGDIQANNAGLDCDRLEVGKRICVPLGQS